MLTLMLVLGGYVVNKYVNFYSIAESSFGPKDNGSFSTLTYFKRVRSDHELFYKLGTFHSSQNMIAVASVTNVDGLLTLIVMVEAGD